jgi:hypothetical protein
MVAQILPIVAEAVGKLDPAHVVDADAGVARGILHIEGTEVGKVGMTEVELVAKGGPAGAEHLGVAFVDALLEVVLAVRHLV